MTSTDDTGKLILRLALGFLVLLHGIAKLSSGVGFISGMLVSHGIPGGVAYLAYVGEILAPLLIIVGFYTRPAACIIAINLVVAVWLVHSTQLLSIGKTGGLVLEIEYIYLFAAIAIAFLGAGRFSVGGERGRFN